MWLVQPQYLITVHVYCTAVCIGFFQQVNREAANSFPGGCADGCFPRDMTLQIEYYQVSSLTDILLPTVAIATLVIPAIAALLLIPAQDQVHHSNESVTTVRWQ
jgi:hypothetical protein